ncbi:ElaB/YqjD/DUF883 family membrane-anchored ribosome-binding protein [Paenarthrobacter sp. TE4293]|uniref:hypothetical protein n=1 Tax=Paenarthrobacter sp. TE4293 TaxID=3381695 RepID=UPI003D221C8B
MTTTDSSSPVALNPTNSEGYGNRLRWIEGISKQLSTLSEAMPGFAALLNDGDNVDVETAARVIEMWIHLLSNEHVRVTFAQTPLGHEESHWLRGSDLQELQFAANQITQTFQSLTELTTINFYAQKLLTMLRAALRRSSAFNIHGPIGLQQATDSLHQVQEELLQFDADLDERLRKRQETAVAETEEARSAAKRASGATGQNLMSTYYAKLGKDEIENADRFRKLTVQFAIAGGAAALIFLLLPQEVFGSVEGAQIWVRLAQKVVFLGGVFALAGYFAKQAHQHRSLANWAQALAVQLQTFEAYLAAVDDRQVKDELIKNFAGRAFGEHPALKGEQPVTSSAALIDTAANLAAKFTSSAK